MSGIESIKKKAKLSMEEMYESPLPQDSGQPAIQQSIKPESHKTREMDIDISAPQLLQTSTAEQMQIRHSLEKNKMNYANQEISQSENTLKTQEKSFLNSATFGQQESQAFKYITGMANKQNSNTKTHKMTFVLPEDIYIAFNHLYAQRIMQGRKTDKSFLICEAIEWLLKMENEKS